MQTVGVGVGQDADLVIAQVGDVRRPRVHADGNADVVHFLGRGHLTVLQLPGVEDLAAQGHDRLRAAIARLPRRATGRVALDQEQLRALGILVGAVGQLARQGGARHRALARDALGGLDALLGVGDGVLRDALAGIRVLVQPQRRGVAGIALDQLRGFARAQALLGLAGELRLAQLHRQHKRDAAPDVLGRELHATRQQVAELRELAHRRADATAQAVDVRAAAGGRNEIDVALGHGLRHVRRPDQRPFHGIVGRTHLAGQGLLGHAVDAAELLEQVFAERTGVEPLFGLAGGLVLVAHAQAGAQDGLGLERVAQVRDQELVRVEELRVWPEVHRRAGAGLGHRAHLGELGGEVPVVETDVVLLATAPHPAVQLLGERVDHGHADAVQAAGIAIGAVGELTAGMQPREDQLDAADFLDGVDVHRHAAAVVRHRQRAVLVQDEADLGAVARQRLIDTVVDHLMREVVRAGGLGVHARATPDRIEAGEDLDI